jgi:hypothetical protein
MVNFVKLADGTIVEATVVTKREVQDIARRPQVLAALTKLADKNAEVGKWLLDNQEAVLKTYVAGSVTRVTKAERKALSKAVEFVVETLAKEPKVAFLVEHADDIVSAFKWPTQKRTEDKGSAVLDAFLELTDDNEDLAKWLIDNKDALNTAYNTGKPKPSEATLAILAEARAKAAAMRTA